MSLNRIYSFVALVVLACLVFSAQAEDINPQRYDIYKGHVDANGYQDYYFHGKDIFVLIHGDISVPIAVKGPASFVVYQNASGFSAPQALNLSTSKIASLTPAVANRDYFSGDFNGDGQQDMILRSPQSNGSAVVLHGKAGTTRPSKAYQYPSDHDISNRSLGLTIEDRNGDGRDDVVIKGGSYYGDTIYYSNGTAPLNYAFDNSPEVRPATLVGSSAGQFRVDESGSSTYSMPLALPAGTAGVAPSLALNYSSQGGNGLLGQGWSLSGLSAVTRCRQTLGQDGIAKPISWNSNDRFCLDGQRLVLNSGTYGGVGATYKTEIDSFVTVTSVGGSAGRPASFIVARKDGSTSYYGVTADSKQMAGAQVLSWAQSEFKDSVGEFGNSSSNSIKYSYIDGGNGHRISQIKYAYGASGVAKAVVTFAYQGRHDDISGFVSGQAMNSTQRLSSVTIKNDGRELRRYYASYLRYSRSEQNRLSRIAALQECVGSDCLPATRFDWSGNQLAISGSASGTISLSHQGDRGVLDFKPADFDGDGNMDVAWIEWDADGEDTDQRLMYAMSNGSSMTKARFSHGADHVFYAEDVNGDYLRMEVIDYNADGRQDVVVYNSRGGKWNVHLSLPQGDGTWKLSGSPSATLSAAITSSARFQDLNSDGLVDVLVGQKRWFLQRNSNAISSNNGYSFVAKSNLAYVALPAASAPSSAGYPGDLQQGYYSAATIGSGDFDGDGSVDTLKLRKVEFLFNEWAGVRFYVRELFAISNSSGSERIIAQYKAPETDSFSSADKAQVGDFNGDGLSDVVYGNKILLSNGQGFESPITWAGYKNTPQVLDYNGDGRSDVIWHDDSAKQIKVSLWNGSTLASPFNIQSTNGDKKHAHIFLDLNGDGFLDRLYFSGNSLSSYKGVGMAATESRYTIKRIENGLGNVTDISYGSLSRSGHYVTVDANNTIEGTTTRTIFNDCPVKHINPTLCGRSEVSTSYTRLNSSGFYSRLNGDWSQSLPSGSQFLTKATPTLELNGPMMVVTGVSSSAPKAGSSARAVNHNAKSAISYYYAEAKLQAGGRGFLGFHKIKTVDEQTQVATTTTYRQDFPLIGHPLNTEVRSKQGKLLSMATNTWRFHTLGSGRNTRYQPYIYKSEEVSKDLLSNGAGAGNTLQTVTTTNAYDTYGNPTRITVSTAGGGDTFTKTTVNSYGSADYQEKGRLTATTVTSAINGVSGSDTSVRSSSFDYYPAGATKYLLKSETVAAGTDLQLTTEYEYDAFGNKSKATQTTVDGVRFSESEFEDGRYLKLSKNALGHTTETITARDPATGAPTLIDAANGAQTTIGYDVLGREISRSSNSGAWADTQYDFCGSGSGCPTGAVFKVSKSVSGGGSSAEYFDILGRNMRSESVAFNGSKVYVDTEYDALGRVKRKSNPYYSSHVANLWTVNEYDILGRVTRATLPDGSWGKTDYSGYTSTITNHAGNSKREVKNAQGQLVRVIDNPDGGSGNSKAETSYRYDADGNLRFMASHPSEQNIVYTTELRYDALGRKTYMNDPDKGEWEYRYNAFGELVWQMDAKSQVSDMAYDTLGRMQSRTDRRADNTVEGYSYWYYDKDVNGSAQANAQGQVTAVVMSSIENNKTCTKASGNYCKLYQYDDLGRAQRSMVSLPDSDDLFITETVYDTLGRVLESRDVLNEKVSNLSTHSSESGTVNYYTSLGYLDRVEDINSGKLIQKVTAMNARGQVTQLLRGNGATSHFGYDDATGRMLSQRADIGGSFDIQRINYQWDSLGNLSSRHNTSSKVGGGNNNLQESFCYDALNRLVKSAVGSITPACGGDNASDNTIAYDSLGNITRKDGVGTYTYGDNSAFVPVSNGSGVITIGDVDDSGRDQILLPPGSTLDIATASMNDADWNSSAYFSDAAYDVYYGDLNGDGKTDIYFQGGDNLVLLHGDIVTPVLVRTPSFAVYQTGSGDSAGYGAPVAHSQGTAGLTQAANDQVYYGNFSGSGSGVFIRGTSGAPALVLSKGGAVSSSAVVGVLPGSLPGASGVVGPHAVVATSDGVNYSYDNNGNMIADSISHYGQHGGRVIEYSTFDKATKITRGSNVVEFDYGPSRSRYKRVDQDGSGKVVTTHYLGSVERITNSAKPGVVEWRRALDGGAIFTVTTDAGTTRTDFGGELFHTVSGSVKEQYLYKDHLGSLDVITDGTGTVLQSMSFDPWGARREVADWGAAVDAYWASPDSALTSITGLEIDKITRRGFTGHEMVDSVGIIHMNGRIYDARIARFLQADPHVQAPTNTQSLNRYAYVWNNPLNATDPSGYFVGLIIAAVAYAAGAITTTAMAMQMVAFVAIATAMQTKAMGGTWKQAAIAGVSSFAMGYAGVSFMPAGGLVGAGAKAIGKYALKMAVVGGITSTLQGGNFGNGFVSAGLGAVAAGSINLDGQGAAVQVGVKAVVGGTISEMTGGKFANGAVTSAFMAAATAVASKDSVTGTYKKASSKEELKIEWLKKYNKSEGKINLVQIKGNVYVNTKGSSGDAFVLDVNVAKAYAELAGENIFDELAVQNSKTIINFTSGESFHAKSGGNSLVMWNPSEGYKLPNGNQSPALGLIHELGHSKQFLIEGIQGDLPENPVIHGIETRVANFYGAGTRTKHSQGKFLKVPCVTCR